MEPFNVSKISEKFYPVFCKDIAKFELSFKKMNLDFRCQELDDYKQIYALLKHKAFLYVNEKSPI